MTTRPPFLLTDALRAENDEYLEDALLHSLRSFAYEPVSDHADEQLQTLQCFINGKPVFATTTWYHEETCVVTSTYCETFTEIDRSFALEHRATLTKSIVKDIVARLIEDHEVQEEMNGWRKLTDKERLRMVQETEKSVEEFFAQA